MLTHCASDCGLDLTFPRRLTSDPAHAELDSNMTDHPVVAKRKLIEVALPLDAINKASAREKSIRHGHPSTLHLWWARRPLAAARAVIFAQMVDDPSANPDLFPTEAAQEKERQRLFGIIEELVKWENTTNETVLQQARDEIWQSWRRTCAANADHPRADELFDRNRLPAFHDPFAGGGSLPLEAQRLGLEAHASDLNPVAVLINKAMIEIPPKFAAKPPVNPETRSEARLTDKTWRGAEGLADDVRYYGQWMRDEAERRIGGLYPTVLVTEEIAADRPDLEPYVGRALTVIAWLWARTVKSPNPAFADVDVPLASTFVLSKKRGKEAWVEPVIEGRTYRFEVHTGTPPERASGGTKAGRGSNFICVMSQTPIDGDYIKDEGRRGRMDSRLMAIVAEGDRGRVYLTPPIKHEYYAKGVGPSEWKPLGSVPARLTGGTCVPYGLDEWWKLFTRRQMVALTTFSDLVSEAREQIRHDAVAAGLRDDGVSLQEGGVGVAAYADGVATYLGLLVNQVANHSSTGCGWNNTNAQMRAVFARQAIPMVWDYAESNPFCSSSGSYANLFERQTKGFVALGSSQRGEAWQSDINGDLPGPLALISTDPPYYDNIGYADLSDFFYVWLRHSIGSTFPELFSTLATPKTQELVATPYRHGGRKEAEAFFLSGMADALLSLNAQAHPSTPLTIYYAFKESERLTEEGQGRTGWSTFLDALVHAGITVVGTWPLRTEKPGRVIGNSANALAASIVVVGRPRHSD